MAASKSRDAKIFHAASTGDTLGVRSALTSGETVNSTDIGKSTALHWAARKGHLGVTALLVSKGASLNIKTKQGKTALDLARDGGHSEVAEFLATASGILVGQTPKRPGAKSRTRRIATPKKLSPSQQEDAQRLLVKWSTEEATKFVTEAEEARSLKSKLAQEAEAAKNSAAEKNARQKAEIGKLLSVIKQAREEMSPNKSPRVVIKGRNGQSAQSSPSGASSKATSSSTGSPNIASYSKPTVSSASKRRTSLGAEENLARIKNRREEVVQRKKKEQHKNHEKVDVRRERAEEAHRKIAAVKKKGVSEAERRAQLGLSPKPQTMKSPSTKGVKKQSRPQSSPSQKLTVVSLDGDLRGRKTSSTRNTPTQASSATGSPSRNAQQSAHRSQLTPKRSSGLRLKASTGSVLSADLEDEYLSWVRGMTDDTKGSGSPVSPGSSSNQNKPITNVTQGSTRTVTIVRQAGTGLGVGIYSSKSGQPGVSVSNVLSQSPFGDAGVEKGDVFIEINGVDVREATHAEAVRLLKIAPERFTLKLWSPRIDRGTVLTAVRDVAPQFTDALDGKTRTVVLERKASEDALGVALSSDSMDRWVQVLMVVPGGLFDRAGVRSNDVILEVSGKSMLAVSHTEVVEALKISSTSIEMKVASLDDVNAAQLPVTAPRDSLSIETTSFEISRLKDKGLGIAICSPKGKTGIRIRNVTPGGPFGIANVPRGSVIVKIDDANMLDATHADVVEALRNAGDSFSVCVATDRVIEDFTRQRAVKSRESSPSRPVRSSRNSSALKPKKMQILRRPNQGLGVALCSNKKRIGVRISQLDPKGPLALAGVAEQDVIVQVNGRPCLKLPHNDVVEAFKNAPTNFTVVVVAGAEFDKVTPTLEEKPISPANVLDEMRTHAPLQSSHGNYASEGASEDDDMRHGPDLVQNDPRVVALENTEGYLALKKAQMQAMSLKESTDMYQDAFSASNSPLKYSSNAHGVPHEAPTVPSESPLLFENPDPFLNKTLDEHALAIMKRELSPDKPIDGVTQVIGRTTARV